jgi:hypothetical protein
LFDAGRTVRALTGGDGHPDWRLELPVLVTADDVTDSTGGIDPIREDGPEFPRDGDSGSHHDLAAVTRREGWAVRHHPASINTAYDHWKDEYHRDPSKIRTDVYYLLDAGGA